jgi:Rod binding domain-containing protein
MFGGGKGEEMYRSLLVEEYGKTIAKAGGVGIADQVKAEMLKLQEVK